MPEKHLWDQVADELVHWVANESQWYTNAILGGGPAPFSQQVSEADKKVYYESQLYLDSGEPNEQGRQEVLQRIGIQAYIPLLANMEKERGNKLEGQAPMSVEPIQEEGY